MDVDLRLMPLLQKNYWCAHNMMDLGRDTEFWPLVASLPQQDIPEPIYCHLAIRPDGERGYGKLETDPYGSRLRWTSAGDLMTLKDHEAVRECTKTRAAWAYLAELPLDWQIVLFWH